MRTSAWTFWFTNATPAMYSQPSIYEWHHMETNFSAFFTNSWCPNELSGSKPRIPNGFWLWIVNGVTSGNKGNRDLQRITMITSVLQSQGQSTVSRRVPTGSYRTTKNSWCCSENVVTLVWIQHKSKVCIFYCLEWNYMSGIQVQWSPGLNHS